MSTNNHISDEMMASFIDGNFPDIDSAEMFNIIAESKELAKVFPIASAAAQLTYEEYNGEPVTTIGKYSFAAHTPFYGDRCCLLSEKYALDKLGVDIVVDDIVRLAESNGWYIPGQGTPVGEIGKISQYYGCEIKVILESYLEQLTENFMQDYIVLAYLDGGELFGDKDVEAIEDEQIGKIADHVVVLEGVDYENREVVLYDPAIGEALTHYDIDDFLDAWDDSNNMVVLIKK